MPDRIPGADEQRWCALDACAPLVAADRHIAAMLREAERRLLVVATVRILYRDVRADKVRIARWSRYLASRSVEAQHQLVTALTLGVAQLQRADQLRQANRSMLAVVEALAAAYAALATAVSLAETPITAPLPAPWGALAAAPLLVSWQEFLVAHPTQAAGLEAQFAQVTAAGVAVREATAADASVAAAAAAVQQSLGTVAGVRRLVAG